MNEIKPEDIAAKLEPSVLSKGGSFEESYTSLQKDSSIEESYLRNKENRDIIIMRKWWGYSVLLFIGVIVIFDITLVILYGFNVLSFSDSNVVIAVVVDGLLKIVGLGYLITKNIFEKVFP